MKTIERTKSKSIVSCLIKTIKQFQELETKLGAMELSNPSIHLKEKVVYKRVYTGEHKEIGKFFYKVKIKKIQDKIGIDFMTNQPIYKARELMYCPREVIK